jgi:hypothetical protein
VLFLLATETGEAGEPLFTLISGGTDPTMPDELPRTLGSSRYSSWFCLLRRSQKKKARAMIATPPTMPTTMPAMAPDESPDFELLVVVPDWSPLGSPVCRGRPPLLLELCPPDDADEGGGVTLADDEEDDDDVELDYRHVSHLLSHGMSS